MITESILGQTFGGVPSPAMRSSRLVGVVAVIGTLAFEVFWLGLLVYLATLAVD